MNNLIYSLNATMPVFLVILIGYILNRLGMFNEGFSTDEVGRIYGILNDFSQFANAEDVLNDYITVLNEYHERINQKEAGSMSNDELLELQKRLTEKQKEKTNK